MSSSVDLRAWAADHGVWEEACGPDCFHQIGLDAALISDTCRVLSQNRDRLRAPEQAALAKIVMDGIGRLVDHLVGDHRGARDMG